MLLADDAFKFVNLSVAFLLHGVKISLQGNDRIVHGLDLAQNLLAFKRLLKQPHSIDYRTHLDHDVRKTIVTRAPRVLVSAVLARYMAL